ncbi:class I glutamine amidotransferase-like protein [Absidia repens]|uniref:D-lactate dehydratase n=1 Tax=Absidia repens TaxID=90262 RepID=A0A1X2IX36_9FUNG|nr:class I glutamine amidotransferase-like protein [Absidia repens]
MPQPRKVILTISSHCAPFYSDGKKTGLFFTEALHPYLVFVKNGFDVDLVSETGSFGYDDHSITPEGMSEDDMKIFKDSNHPFMVKLNTQLKKPADVNPNDYGIFYASAGHATLYDYPKAKGLISIAEKMNANGALISAVCHGPVILPYIMDTNGQPIVKGKTMTGFSNEGEDVFKVADKIKQDGLITLEDAAKKVGANYIPPKTPLEVCVQHDGRVLTGANPASAGPLAELDVKAFQSLA